MQYICAPVYSCFNTWSYIGKQWPQTFANNTFTPDSYIWLNCIIYFHWHFCHTAVLFLFLKLPRNKVEGPGGLLTEPLVWLWKCEIRNVLIHLGDRADTPNLVPVQVFQLTQLLSEDEDRKIQILIAFTWGIIAALITWQMLFPEYPERYGDEQFQFISWGFLLIISVPNSFRIVTSKCSVF